MVRALARHRRCWLAVTRDERATISAYREGPFLVRGPVTIVDEDGREIEVRRSVVPLCRCGRSRTQPLCDGVHEAMAPASAEIGSTDGACDRRSVERTGPA
ncbi:MAG TPA: CDGSH iron-sulfur domain-containing protein [Actinomycetota bacterium]|nr:CDGSH iron-sulfur domain-containing protein [Actinomycetota bacterium]